MESDEQCAREGHDLTLGVDPTCKVCGMARDAAMRDMGFEQRDGVWSIEFPVDQPIEFRGRF